MSFLSKLFPLVSPAPVNSTEDSTLGRWLNEFQEHSYGKASLQNNAHVLNPDMHWYGTARSTDGVVCKPWNIKSNSLAFTATPTPYTATTSNADTGSKQFVNVAVTGAGGTDFEYYQEIKNYMSKYQHQPITITAKINNKSSFSYQMYFYIGIDSTNSGSDDFSKSSAPITLKPGVNHVSASIVMPEISVDNQTNTVTAKMIIPNVTSAREFDVLYIKDEFSTTPTVLHVDHTLEKIRIDNAP